jgi:hypothetical protein
MVNRSIGKKESVFRVIDSGETFCTSVIPSTKNLPKLSKSTFAQKFLECIEIRLFETRVLPVLQPFNDFMELPLAFRGLLSAHFRDRSPRCL